MWLITLIALSTLINISLSSYVDYTGFEVIQFDIRNEEQLKFMQRFEHNSKFIQDEHAMVLGRSVTLGIPPTHVDFVNQQAKALKIETHTVYNDLQTVIDLEKSTVDRRTSLDEFDFDVYHTYESILEQMQVWFDTCPESFECELYTYGTTYEGNELKMLKIGKPGGQPNAYWFHGVTHAREWLSTATLLKVIERFWTGYGTDEDVTEFLDNYDWYFSPMTNPDGYIYTHTDDRMWRKNRAANEGSSCLGTDLNRNYDVVWGTEGISHNPCDYQLYCGDGPGSELENQAITQEVHRISAEKRILAFVDVHTFGQMILMPLSYSINHEGQECARADNHEELLQVSNAFADAIQETYNTVWTRGSPCDILYTVSGGSTDWGVVEGNAAYSFCPELRGPYFTSDPINIEPSSQEFFNGMVAMAEEIKIIEGI